MIASWVFGSVLCKAYHFITSLSYTASIFILVVICMERYLAIQHPITSKQILTSSRLKVSTQPDGSGFNLENLFCKMDVSLVRPMTANVSRDLRRKQVADLTFAPKIIRSLSVPKTHLPHCEDTKIHYPNKHSRTHLIFYSFPH
jgi:hypothetical protein